ncbi:MAG: iron ABC transporter permease [Chitinispirillia bacterium]|nr:iron ABC transporter permease [Chitinispirillia bacterium]MCL2240964.1 iron ABC transporter permease [Chitinispirillia bacterium]
MRLGWPGVSILFALSIISLAVLPFIGMETIGITQISGDDLQREIFFSIRLPRVLTAFTAGAALALCGLVFQGVLRNPLADPFTLGVASGASCGAALMILTGAAGVISGIPVTVFGALCGAALSFLLVMAFSGAVRTVSSNGILLVGIAVSFFFSSVLMFSQYISSMRDSFRIVRWLMGGVEVFGYGPLFTMLPFVITGVILIIANIAALDHFLTGDDIAQTRGVRVRFSRILLLGAASLMVGGIVSVCGPIGFVGLMIPHFCRPVFGAGHKILLPACLLAGGIFLTLCDTFARTLIAPAEIPVGVITALLGAPFLLWVLIRQESR